MFPSPMEKTLQMKMDLTLLIYPSFSLLNVHAFCSYEMRVLLAYISLSKAHKAIWFCVSVSLLLYPNGLHIALHMNICSL